MFRNVPNVLRSSVRQLKRTARLMVGMPDYDAYVAHMHRHHPDREVMCYEDFFKDRQANRYGVKNGSVNRCC
jgi:uncharacterized short protein YbdD (DUF466 family)